MNDSHIVIGKNGGMSFNGPDAVDLFRLVTIKHSIKMHRDLGMIPTRGMTITRLLAIVSGYTGKAYKGKNKHNDAMADLEARIAALKASMPIEQAA